MAPLSRLAAELRLDSYRPGRRGGVARAGITHARPATLFGCERSWLEDPLPAQVRTIDILFAGNLHPAVQGGRLPWLARLARLSETYRVRIETNVHGDAYRELLARSRIAFNHSIRGEANKRAFEAAAAGALLFQEEGNRETAQYFRDRQECIYYNADNLERLLQYYLEHEDERRALAEAARQRVQHFSFAELWNGTLDTLEAEWPAILARAQERPVPTGRPGLLARTWQALQSSYGPEPRLAADLGVALVERPADADLHNALGLVISLTAPQPGQAVGYFQRALAHAPGHMLAGLNLVEALARSGKKEEGAALASRLLAGLDEPAEAGLPWWDGGHFPPGYDYFRVAWEQAAWANAGQARQEIEAKRQLIRWRLQSRRGELTGQVSLLYEAALARPDLPPSRMALGAALRQAGQPAEAVPHLRQALADQPFDPEAARLLFQALGEAGDGLGQRRLAHERRRLCRAAPRVVPVEKWFAQAPPVGDELVSIIILCCNQENYTRQCLDSVLRYSRPPYELVVVDNASSDGTAELLAQVKKRAGTAGGPERVHIITNAQNKGYPAGCNQGLAEAKGQYLAYLNNDTIVTAGWLEGLIRWALYDWPKVGLVGPVTNHAAAPQAVPVDYGDLVGLPAFAERWRTAHANQGQRLERLVGFCLLVRREVHIAIGGFDEQFGLGFFDDDDFCLRARHRGFELVMASDVFIHHFGNRTFAGMGVDVPRQLSANLELFRRKWGDAQAAHYHVADPAIQIRVAKPKLQDTPWPGDRPYCGAEAVTLCMIVKNEEKNIGACLESAKGLFGQIVVVDTGSTDRTKEIAQRYGAKVVDFPWVDSFAAARNEALRHATGAWIFWLDADDRLDEANRVKLRQLLAHLQPEVVGYSLKCHCISDPARDGETVVDHVRLFPNHPGIRWRFRVHEQILGALRDQGGVVRWVDIAIRHVGYSDPILRRQKLARDLHLLLLQEQDEPGHAFTLFNLGSIYQELGRHAEALPYLERSLKSSHPADSIVRKLYALISNSMRQLGRAQEALETCRAGGRYYPDDEELLFLEGSLCQELSDDAGAEASYQRLLASQEADHFASVVSGLRGYKTRHKLALLYFKQGRLAEAEAQWQATLAEKPDLVSAWVGLGDVCLAGRRWPLVEEIATWLAARPDGIPPAVHLRARAALARHEFGPAREMLEAMLAQQPAETRSWLLLGEILLSEGQDLRRAERALVEALRLDPGNKVAQHHLGIIWSRTQPR